MRVVTVEAAGSAMGFNFQFWVKSKRDGPRRRRSSSAAWPRWSPWAPPRTRSMKEDERGEMLNAPEPTDTAMATKGRVTLLLHATS